MSRSLEERVLLLTSLGEDAELCGSMLARIGVTVERSSDLGELCDALEHGAAVLLLCAQYLRAPEIARLADLLGWQPAWSELPVLLLVEGDRDPDVNLLSVRRLGNVTLIERPIRESLLTTAVMTAMRSRGRQYQIREYLRGREEAERALRDSEERLRFSLDAGRLGFWQHDIWNDELTSSALCKAHFGRAPEAPLTHADVLAAVHPEDRERAVDAIRDAMRRGEGYVLEYRVVWPDGSVHWLMVRGRANYDASGKPVGTHGVTMEITERKIAEARQAEIEQALRESARRKDEFLAMLAHELRNPLNPVANAIEIMRARPGRAQGVRAREVLERQLRHMTRLIDDLLDVSRINTGKITLKCERLDLVTAVQAALESVRAYVEEAGHRLETELPATPIYVQVDPVRLEQIVTNLLNNAAKYTEPGGRISVKVEAEGGSALVRVKDTGIGIAPSMLSQIFDLFTQGERGLDRSQGGLGLGLTLVRNLVRQHGGTVEAFSDGPGRGSEFVVSLPLSRIERDEPERAPAASTTTPLPQPAEEAARILPAVTGARPSSIRLLVVDDNRDSAETLAELAEIWGFEVCTAFDGLAALKLACEWLPGLIFLDIGMPGMDGYEVARRLRQDERFRHTTLVALTGYGQEEDLQRSRAAGFDHHLVKPVDGARLEELFRGAMAGAEEPL